jgi:hypothetical protein
LFENAINPIWKEKSAAGFTAFGERRREDPGFFLSLPPLTCLNGFVPKEGIPYFEGKFFMFAARRR